ncbi:MAG: sigma-70 family RNA polymerase sigma factor [Bacteroidota bacterium]|mgnify:CR=1 FL=1
MATLPVNNNHSNDQTTWLQMQQGQSLALEALYDKYVNVLYNYGKGFTSRSEIVEDAIQDLITEIWVKRDRLTVPCSVKGYLLKSFRQKLLRLLTHEKRWQFSGDHTSFLIADSHSATIPEESEECTVFKSRLQKAMSCLSSKQQEAITLRYTENLNHQEIAEIMSIKPQTLYNLLHTAIQKLSRSLKHKPYPVYSYFSLL